LQVNEIIYYQSDEISTHIEVRIEDETVWLNRQQISILFDRDVKTIGKHINNAFKEELKSISVVAKFATTAADGKVYQVEHYNLDMILSVGYRVKSSKGVAFRIWATNVLKSYLLKGYAVQNRIENIEKKLFEHDTKIEFLLNTNLPPSQGIFYDGQIFDAYVFISKIIKSAQKSIVLIDNYIDESVLMLLSKRKTKVTATLYTDKIDKQLQLDINKYNDQYSPISVAVYKKSHDRFLIIDHDTVYHIGASLKDLGKKWFAFSKLNLDAGEIISKLENSE
jgi:hypothetical protein